MRGIVPRGDGGVTVNLSRRERDLLRSLPDQLRPLLAGEQQAPTIAARLFPRGYDDDALEAEYRDLAGDDIVAQRVGAMDVFTRSLDGGDVVRGRWRAELDAETAAAWLSAVNDGRLVLGALLGIDVESQWEGGPTDDNPASVVLHYLGWIEEELVGALMFSLPEADNS